MTLFLSLFLAVLFLILPIDASAKVLINEVLPNPDDEVEAIELTYVPQEGSASEILLNNWTILNSRAVIYNFDQKSIKENEFFVVTFYRKLVNTGDSVIIKDADGVIVDEFDYTISEKGLSYARVSYDQNLFVLTTPSLGEANNVTLTPTPSPTVKVETDTTSHQTQKEKEIHDSSAEFFDEEKTSPTDEELNKDDYNQATTIDINTEELLTKISTHKKFLDNETNNKKMEIPNLRSDNFVSTLTLEISHTSSTKILSVIIGGLLFFISSRLIYE